MHRQQLIQHLAAEAQPVQVVHDGFCAGFGDAVNPEYFIAVGQVEIYTGAGKSFLQYFHDASCLRFVLHVRFEYLYHGNGLVG